MRRILAVVTLAAALAACASTTPYQARGPNQSYGYTDTQIEADRVRVTFRGNSLTDRETVETYLLYRAAELTLERGFDHFVLAARDVDSQSRLSPTLSGRYSGFSPYWSYYHPRFGWRPYYDPFWSDPVEYRQITQFEANAEIMMRKGPKPAGDAAAFDARDVRNNLEARIQRAPTN